MHIRYIGHAILPTPASSSLALKLVHHVPNTTRNLFSMSKLSNDNDVFMELHPRDFFCKGSGHESTHS
jgi:hypothetical protein